MVRGLIILTAGFFLAAPSLAAPLAIKVVDTAGKPVRDAVVTLYPTNGAHRPLNPGRFTVAQKSLKFQPFLSVVPIGSSISFPNFDSTKHHVYSFSPAKKFELKLFAKDQSRTVQFDKPGVIALGCNIHDAMSAFIVVTDSKWTQRTNAQGVAMFTDAPNSAGKVTVWHPYLRAPGGQVQQNLAAAQRGAGFAIKLRPPPAMTMSGY